MNQQEEIEFIKNLNQALKKPRYYRPLKAKKAAEKPNKLDKLKSQNFVIGTYLLTLFIFSGIVWLNCHSTLIMCTFIVIYSFAVLWVSEDKDNNTSQDNNSSTDLFLASEKKTKSFLDPLELYTLKDTRKYDDSYQQGFKLDDSILKMSDKQLDNTLAILEKSNELDNILASNQTDYPHNFFCLLQYADVIGVFDQATKIVNNSDKMLALSKALTRIDSYEEKPQDQTKYEKLQADYYIECQNTVKKLAELVKPTVLREASRIMNEAKTEDVKILPKKYQQKAVDDYVKNL